MSEFWSGEKQEPEKFIIRNGVLVGYRNGFIDDDFVVRIPNEVKGISCEDFGHNSSIKHIFIPESIELIDEEHFAQSLIGLVSIDVDEKNTHYHSSNNCLINTEEKRLIKGCGNSSIPNDGSVESIGRFAFYKCKDLVDIFIPACITKVEFGAFRNCSLDKILVEDGNKEYHSNCGCLIETKSKTLIKGSNNATIPDDGSVTTIETCAFCDCKGIDELFIPDCIEKIGVGAFYNIKKISYSKYMTATGSPWTAETVEQI